MIASTHLTVGAAVGVLSHQFIFKSDSVVGLTCAVIWGVVSHLALDMIPHNEDQLYRLDGTNKYEVLVLSIEIMLTLAAIYVCGIGNSVLQNTYLLAGMIGGALPDVPHVVMNVFKLDWSILKAMDELNIFFHTPLHPSSFLTGIIPQVLATILSLSILLFFKVQLIKATP